MVTRDTAGHRPWEDVQGQAAFQAGFFGGRLSVISEGESSQDREKSGRGKKQRQPFRAPGEEDPPFTHLLKHLLSLPSSNRVKMAVTSKQNDGESCSQIWRGRVVLCRQQWCPIANDCKGRGECWQWGKG